MKKTIRIKDHTDTRIISFDDFPLMIGGSDSAGIPVPGLGKQKVAAYISVHEGQFFAHSAKTGVTVRHNREKLKGSSRMAVGDTLTIDSTVIVYREGGEGTVFEVSEQDNASRTVMPAAPGETSDERIIEAVPFHPGRERSRPMVLSRFKWYLGGILGILFIILLYSAWFVFTAKQVVIEIDPTPDRISIKGGILKTRFGNYYLLRPGNYNLNALKQGYHPIEQPFHVSKEKSQKLTFAMAKLPGRIHLTAYQEDQPSLAIEGARVYLDGEEIGLTPLSAVEVKPGLRQLVIKAEHYKQLPAQLEIEGGGISQSFTFALVPGWAEVKITTLPTGAQVSLDGTLKGTTPFSVKLSEGTYELKLSVERYKTWHTQLEVIAHQPQVLDEIKLQPADGILVLRSTPSKASVTVGGNFAGQTPLEIPLRPEVDHRILISKAGYEKIERKVRVTTAGVKSLKVELVARTGVVHFKVTPGDAELFINGKSRGTVPQSVTLRAVPQSVKIVKKGYEPYQKKITPRPGFPQKLKVTLKKKLSVVKTSTGVIKASNGYALKLIGPGSFTMGSSRREQGRRSNETLRSIVLARPFYMGVREVSNKEFRNYLASHGSGVFKGQSLNRDAQPVVKVTWEQAALFCNWLSEKDKLPLVYSARGGKLLPQEPLSTGYRLPTEAEWEYCARFTPGAATLLYPWGDTFPPPSKTVNIADQSAKDLLAAYLENYNDGYPVAAPAASFKANALGLYNFGGNVAEWCHDYYSIYSYSSDTRYRDPAGPLQGKHHVMRGPSWRQSSISTVRSAYRDYGNDVRIDLGFRICRYAE